MTALFTLERERIINLKTGKGRDEWVARPKRRRSWTDEALRAALDEIGRRKMKAVLMGSNTEEVARRVAPDAFHDQHFCNRCKHPVVGATCYDGLCLCTDHKQP